MRVLTPARQRTTELHELNELHEQLPQLRERLLEQHRFRLDQLAELASAGGTGHPVTGALDEVAAVLEAGARHALADIDAALARIDAGTYGTCLDCHRPIGLPQLRDIPRVALCFGCRRRTHPG